MYGVRVRVLVAIAATLLLAGCGPDAPSETGDETTARPSIDDLEKALHVEPMSSRMLTPFLAKGEDVAVACLARVLNESDVSDHLLIQIVDGTYELPSAADGPIMQLVFVHTDACVRNNPAPD